MAPIYSQPRLAASQQAEIYFLSPWNHAYQATPAPLRGTSCTLIKLNKGATPQSVISYSKLLQNKPTDKLLSFIFFLSVCLSRQIFLKHLSHTRNDNYYLKFNDPTLLAFTTGTRKEDLHNGGLTQFWGLEHQQHHKHDLLCLLHQ